MNKMLNEKSGQRTGNSGQRTQEQHTTKTENLLETICGFALCNVHLHLLLTSNY